MGSSRKVPTLVSDAQKINILEFSVFQSDNQLLLLCFVISVYWTNNILRHRSKMHQYTKILIKNLSILEHYSLRFVVSNSSENAVYPQMPFGPVFLTATEYKNKGMSLSWEKFVESFFLLFSSLFYSITVKNKSPSVPCIHPCSILYLYNFWLFLLEVILYKKTKRLRWL